MRKHFKTLLLPALLILASTAHGAPVAVESEFIGGVFGNFDISYTTGEAGLKLQEVTIELKSPLFTDPSFVPPGSLLPFSFVTFSGAATTGFAGVNGVFDGATSFTLLFNDFDAGENFNFELDVDTPCGNIFCQTPTSLTTGPEFAGSKIIGTFGGTGYKTTVLDSVYSSTGAFTANAGITGDVNPVPEPGTLGLLGAGLMIGALRARRRSA